MQAAFSTIGLAIMLTTAVGPLAAAADRVSFVEHPTSLEISIDGRPFATYVWQDPKIMRPYFAHLRAPSGVQVTRHHPPVDGRDATDHAELHPGLWLAFGDVSGRDFWRNKGTVEHVKFESKPGKHASGYGFSIRNRYQAEGQTICDEVCDIEIVPGDRLTALRWRSTFSGPREFYFGDQEEMGLGIRVATPMTVKQGGQITNSDGLINEKQVWGKQAAWCDYSGEVDGQAAGITIIPAADNFRRSWFHARDYGVLVANPFGQKAFTKAEASKVVVRSGESLQLGFEIVVHDGLLDASGLPEYLRGTSAKAND